MTPLIITVAPTGAETMREDNPNLPLTPVEIAEEAANCREAGASMMHLHARLPDGTPTQSKEVYEEIVAEVRKRSDIIVQVSCGGAVGMTPDERLDSLRSAPEMVNIGWLLSPATAFSWKKCENRVDTSMSALILNFQR